MQKQRILAGHGHIHEPYEIMCGYLESIRIYFNEHPEVLIYGFEVDAVADCDQRLEDLIQVLKHKGKPTMLSHAGANIVDYGFNI